MAETARILNPSKTVLLPDLDAGWSLSDSCPAHKLADYKAKNPTLLVVAYVIAQLPPSYWVMLIVQVETSFKSLTKYRRKGRFFLFTIETLDKHAPSTMVTDISQGNTLHPEATKLLTELL